MKDTNTEAELKDAFRVLDENVRRGPRLRTAAPSESPRARAQGVGYIGCADLKQICKNLGEELDDQEVFDMVSEALSNFDGKIYYDGLKKIMLPS